MTKAAKIIESGLGLSERSRARRCKWRAFDRGTAAACGGTRRAAFNHFVAARVLGKCQLDTAEYIRHYVRLPGDWARGGAAPPRRSVADLPCDWPLNHKWRHTRPPRDTLYAFVHNKTADWAAPRARKLRAAAAPAVDPALALWGRVVAALPRLEVDYEDDSEETVVAPPAIMPEE